MKRKIKIILGAITVFFGIYLICGFTYIHLKNEAISQNISAVAQQEIKTATTTSEAEEENEDTATKESISDSSVVEESAEKVEESKENTSEFAEQEQEDTATGIINKADIPNIKEEIIEKDYKMDYNTDNQILGYVVVPEVDLALPITKGINKTEDNMLFSAVTNLQGQQMGKGNFVLSSHRLGTSQSLLFSPLHNVVTGDKVYITDTQKTYEYTVYKTFLFESSEVNTLKEIKDYNITTLYTCYYENGVKLRFGVRAVLTDITPYKQNKDLFKAVIN